MLNIFKQIKEFFVVPSEPDTNYVPNHDEADDEDNNMDYKTDEQLDTTDVPDLESEESAEQRKKIKRTRIKNINSTTDAY